MTARASTLTAGSNTYSSPSYDIMPYVGELFQAGVLSGLGVTAQGSPNMTVAVAAGNALVTATPTSESARLFRFMLSASSNVPISANSSGSTKYDLVYIKLPASSLQNPPASGDITEALTLLTERKSSAGLSLSDTNGLVLAEVTVANGATSIATGDIADKRTWSSLASTVYDKVRVSKSGTQSIANSTDVQITFETETFDTNGLHSTSTNPSRFTAVKAGYYQVSVTVDWAVNATGIREVSIRKNGSTVSGNVTQAVTTATRPTRQTHSDIVSLAVGDYIEANVVQTSGGALNIDTGTYMSMVQLA